MNDAIAAKLARLSGTRTSQVEIDALTAALPWVPASLLEMLTTYPLAGSKFTLSEDDDESGMGVEMLWLTTTQMIDEALQSYPGIAAGQQLFVPVGACLLGTGDPYFVRWDATDQLTLYRIPHSALTVGNTLNVAQVERITALSQFFELASAR